MVLNTIKYFAIGVVSAILSWLPITLWGNGDAPKIVGVFIIFLPAIVLGIFLFSILNYKSNIFSDKPIKCIAIFTLLSCVGWASAIFMSTVGMDFTLSADFQSSYELFVSGLLPSMVGMFFIGGAIYVSARKALLFSTVKIISAFIIASVMSIVLFSITVAELSEVLAVVISSLTGEQSHAVTESANILVLFLSWHTVLFSAIPHVVKLDGVEQN